MNETECGQVESPQPISNDNTIFVVKNNKIIGSFYKYTRFHCEFCGRRITNHDRIEAPYADGKYRVCVQGGVYGFTSYGSFPGD